ncbi:hypothetical protein TNCV_5123551 [Trichonephila clavipes]|nr:hypothetical protein TNCV_5123551 [Trichonephila clavipes]
MEVKLRAEEETRLKAEEEAKAVEERRKIEEERRMNETIVSEDKMKLKKDETYGEKEETPVDVRKDKAKGDVNTAILSRERVDLDDDEIEEEKPKLLKRKLKKLSRMIVAKLQQKVNLKA